MDPISKIAASAGLAASILLTGCATTRPVAYSGIASAAQMQVNVREDADRKPYVYSTNANWPDYASMIIEPVAVYAGADHQFGDVSQADRQELARYMATAFRGQMAQRFRMTNAVAPATLRLKLTLTGAETNTAVVSTLTRFDLVGLPYNTVQSVRGKEGLFMGSVSYAVEIHDAQTHRLLQAFVARQHPNAMNVGATLGSLGAAKTGIEKGAEQLLEELR